MNPHTVGITKEGKNPLTRATLNQPVREKHATSVKNNKTTKSTKID
ncbi:MAG: hypothetical protein KBD78_03055 [Oligoflexales bacterium]|nr:hypothetical protein [Oligoflexales bacterium]